MATCPAVGVALVEIDARAVAVGEARQTAATGSITTSDPWRALVSARPAVVGVGVQVDAGAATVGGAGWTHARPAATDGPVTTAWRGRGARLSWPVVAGRCKGVLQAQGGEDPTEGAGQHALEHLPA